MLQIIILEPIFVLFCRLKLFDNLHSMLLSEILFLKPADAQIFVLNGSWKKPSNL